MESDGTSKTLADPNIRQSGSATITEPAEAKQSKSGDDGGERELADTVSKRSKTEPEPADTGNKGLTNDIEHRMQAWPARPGQEQYEWEEPRTVKPGMGRTVDGFKSRVDELRLLGNGVVPQTAELAFRTLWNKII
jgi:hypothetical protein